MAWTRTRELTQHDSKIDFNRAYWLSSLLASLLRASRNIIVNAYWEKHEPLRELTHVLHSVYGNLPEEIIELYGLPGEFDFGT